MKTRYCGHLYSSLLCKWTWWDHRDQVSYYMEGGLKGTEGSPPGWVGGLVGHPVSALLLLGSEGHRSPFGVERKGGLEWALGLPLPSPTHSDGLERWSVVVVGGSIRG